MDEDANAALLLSLRYYNSDELQNIAQVSRYHYVKLWYVFATYEKAMRNSTHCIIDELKFNHRIQWTLKDRHNINFFNKIPCLQICFINDKYDVNLPSGCPCRTKQFSSFTVNLKSYYNIKQGIEINPHFTLNIPITSLKELTTFSFINHSMEDEYSNEQQNLNYVNDKIEIETLFVKVYKCCETRKPNSVVLIMLCQSCFFLELLDLMDAVARRIQMYDITTWGATIDALSICRFSLHKNYCKIDTKFLFIFINKPEIRNYVGFLDENCNDENSIRETFIRIKRQIALSLFMSSNPIAFMHVSYCRLKELYALDTSIFREVFPNVCLFPFYGDISFNINGLIDLLDDLNKVAIKNPRKMTSFIILYNY